MDCIEVIDQKIFAYHGVLPEEKETGQYFYISFKAYLNISEAADQDDMSLSVSYADMCRTVKKAVVSEVYDLIETVADRTAKALLMAYPKLQRVVLTVKKPSAPVGEPVAYPAVTVDRQWHQAYIAIGSNMGDSRQIIRTAIDLLDEHVLGGVTAEATIVETEPWGKTDQENFFNTAIGYRTLLAPRQLMKLLLETEAIHGRERHEKWGPRTLDLDLVLYDDLISDDPYVTLPHPLMEERAFVLEPLTEIAPNVCHPVLNERIGKIYERFKNLSTT